MKKIIFIAPLIFSFLCFIYLHSFSQNNACISLEELYSKTWQFGRGDGSFIAGGLKFLPGGKISGYYHPNEARWAYDGCLPLFISKDGSVTTFFTSATRENNKLLLSGPYRPNPTTIHTLREK